RNVPIATGNMSDALEALVGGKFVTLRVPYPMGFHAKGMDGRNDDATMGWKSRGVWSTYAGRAVPHRGRPGHDQQGCEVSAPRRHSVEFKVCRLGQGKD